MKPLFVASLTLVASSAFASKKPNIIFIVTDDQHFSTMKCWGGDVLTPNIDRLAHEGVKFNRAYVASSVSSPARYSLLSGRYSGRCRGEQFMDRFPLGTTHRIDNTSLTLEDDMPNLPKLLREGGYTTGMVGKWHVGEHFNGNIKQQKEAMQRAGLKGYAQDASPSDPEVQEALLHNHQWYAEQIKAQGFDYTDNIYWANLREIYCDQLNYHNIDWSVKGAIDFMDQAEGKPFFLYFSTTLHHGPEPKRSLPERFEKVTSKGFAEEKMGVMPDRSTLYERLREAGVDESEAYTLWLDDAVGALLDDLERRGEAENTIIFYISDHGIDQKSSMYEGGIRTPFMVWGGDVVARGEESSALVHACDLAATALSIAEVEAPKRAQMDGYDLTPLLKAPDMEWRKSVYSEVGYARCVVTERYKYIAVRYPEPIQKKYDRGFTTEEQEKIGYITNQGLCALGKTNPNYFTMDQLYDLQEDPMEQNNLAAEASHRQVMKQMRELMGCYLSKFNGRPFYDLYDGESPTKKLNEFK
ncbi:MAG: sulfatase-like hydrolase/transferase [Rikenellaceae bacterium]